MPDILLENAPPLGGVLNDADGLVRRVEKLGTESRHASLVELGCLDKFRFRIWVVNQRHPIARRADCMTFS